MKITDVRTVLLTHVYEGEDQYTWSAGTTARRHVILVQVTTDEGIYGLGEVGDIGFAPASIVEIVNEGFRDILIGEDPSHLQRLVRLMYRRSAPVGRKGLTMMALSGVEQALWDVLGKAAGLPVYRLLGGIAHERIPAYASAGMSADLKEMAADARRLIQKGYRALKVRIGYGLQRDIEIVAAMKDVTGKTVDLMVDAAQGYSDAPWTFNTALHEARALEEFDLRWIEEPLALDDLDGYIALARSVDTPVATGENEVGVYGFRPLIAHRGADIVQPDVTHAGGILECRRIADLAEVHGIECAPHIFKGGISLAANVHFAVATPNCIFVELDETPYPLRDVFLSHPIELNDGFIRPPTLPGLGVVLPEGIEDLYPYQPGPEIMRPR